MKRRITSLLIALSMVFSAMPFFSLGNFSLTAYADGAVPSGSGLADDPYKIGSKDQLAWFRDKVNGLNGLEAQADACAVLISDIDLSGDDNWTSIGTTKNRYSGTFDGRNYKIESITMNHTSDTYMGFFGYVQRGIISNLHLRITSAKGYQFGGLVGYASHSTIKNCSVDGDISSTGYTDQGWVGMMVGTAQGDTLLQNCWSDGSVTNCYDAASHFVSRPMDGTLTIDKCYSTANTTSYNRGGGFVGVTIGTSTVKITDSYIDGNISVTKKEIGTMAGGLANLTSINATNSHVYRNIPTLIGRWDNYNRDKNKRTYTNFVILGNSYSTSSSSDGNMIVLPANNYYTNSTYFTDWNFEDTWEIRDGAKYPTLKQSVEIESASKRTIYLYDDEVTTITLPDYFNLVLSTDKEYHQYGCFNFDIKDNKETTKEVLNTETDENDEVTYTLASNDAGGDALELDGSIGVGTYQISVDATDVSTLRSNQYGTFNIPLDVVVKHKVPEPVINPNGLGYSRMTTLYNYRLNDDWDWTDGSIVPKTDPNGNTYRYEAYYPFEAGKSDLYDLSALDDAGISYTVDEENNRFIVKLSPKVLESEESQKSTYITIKNADTNAPVAGAYVACDYEDEFPDENYNYHFTDENGEVYAELSPVYRNIQVQKAGFTPKVEQIYIDSALTTNRAAIKIVPTRYSFTAPAVYEKETDGTPTENKIADASVTITKADGIDAEAWNGGDKSLTVSAEQTDIELPEGVFMLRNATYGYSSDDTVYLEVVRNEDQTTFTTNYYKKYLGGTLSEPVDAGTLYAAKLTEPTYYLTIDKDSSDTSGLTYTATVTLANIKATFGSFGLKYDTSLFDLDKVEFSDAVGGYAYTAEELYSQNTSLGLAWDDSNGYYDFLWSADDPDGEGAAVDAELKPQKIAKFTFKLAKPSDANYITVDSFFVEPWQDTKAAKKYKNSIGARDDKFWEHFRYVDEDNSPASLKEGRIAASMSAVEVSDSTNVTSTMETNGFFQASVSGSYGDEELADFYDVRTIEHYNFEIKNSVFRFHVTEKFTGDEIEEAQVRLFEPDYKLAGVKKTDYTGRTSFYVDMTRHNDPNFNYDVSKYGYWPLPLSGLISDRPVITAEKGKAIEVEVELEQKVYHEPVVSVDNDDKLAIVGDADLGGEKYAYNNRPYHFRIKGAKGYRVTQYPEHAAVYVKSEDGEEYLVDKDVQPDANGLFTLNAEKLVISNNEYLRAMTEEDYNGLSDDEKADAYKDWTYVNDQPNAEGYRGFNLIVRFDDFSVEEIRYQVEGVTNKNGHVTYTADTDAGELPMSDYSSLYGVDYSYIKVLTKTKQNDGVANHKTGTFTFAGNTEDDVVDKVFINGLQIHTYDDLPGFTYSFGDVDMDCNITVLYRNGDTPSTDSVMTLVVGEFGKVSTSKPAVENDIMLTRRVYINPQDDLAFTAEALNGYELYEIREERNGGEITKFKDVRTETVTEGEGENAKEHTYYHVDKIDKPGEGENLTVYVTFKNKQAQITPSLFVKSYVYTGKGVNDPAGILIYSMFDSVEIDLTGGEGSWLVNGVKQSPYEDYDNEEKMTEYDFPKPLKTNTYRYDTLLESMAFGSIFAEEGYPLEGYIDLGQGGDWSSLAPLTGATVTFVRLDDYTKEELPKSAKYITRSLPLRRNSLFSLELPAGHWNVYVTKQGYTTYKITDFEMTKPEYDSENERYKTTYFDGADNSKSIIPYIGSTVTGVSISLTDAAGVKSGMRSGINAAAKTKADVNNDNTVNATDLSYVWYNYNRTDVEQTYESFKQIGSLTNPANTSNP